ncbi:methyl-accepting chemotaxis protein [Shewanella xiamenensis]|uniref:methyl-accepting chemotaxis protein n=1 Tax=Shewanella xiamenensis TaxID=332186 RepID=UPI002E7B8EE7|nr:methyl-accepting chemotaxis protein [Shewanella xiamenensis]MEE1982062.1 methyl-accepting chemotaxis protein [Shewanella xiamenensis]
MKNLALKVQIGLAAAIFMIVSALFGASYWLASNKLMSSEMAFEDNTVANLQVTMAQPIFTYDYEQIRAVLSSMLKSKQIYQITVVDHRGKLLAEDKQAEAVAVNYLQTRELQFSDQGNPTGRLTITFSILPVKAQLSELLLSYFIQALLILAGSLVVIFIILKRLVITPLDKVVTALEEIANGDGDLSHRLPVETEDEIGKLANAFNGFVEQIHGTISRVHETSSLLLGDAKALGTLSQSNNQRVQAQLKETEAAVTAVTQLSASANEVAINAKRTADAATQADRAVDDGQRQFDSGLAITRQLAAELTRSAQSVSQLQQETQRIDEVVVVISSIAEQTNLLALNAAIEAARAGEQGRGFAVVADEVRSLTSRTQQATGEIQKMIQQVQSRVAETVNVMQSSQTLSNQGVNRSEEIKLVLSKVTDLVSNISNMNIEVSHAAQEQTCVTEAISRTLNDLANVSGSASLDSEHLAQSSERLFHQGERLRTLVTSFRL